MQTNSILWFAAPLQVLLAKTLRCMWLIIKSSLFLYPLKTKFWGYNLFWNNFYIRSLYQVHRFIMTQGYVIAFIQSHTSKFKVTGQKNSIEFFSGS